MVKKLGLLGKTLSHSFSKEYFSQKFEKEKILDFSYQNFELDSITDFSELIELHPELIGLNVTVPYKEKVLQYVDYQDDLVKKIGAANTLFINNNKKIYAYNTDVIGFLQSIEPLLQAHHKSALILGTGGASKAVAQALSMLHIPFTFVSRIAKNEHTISYDDLSKSVINAHEIVINTTPLGSYPNINTCPDFPFDFVTDKHIFYDLVYNPEQTLFLSKAKKMGAITSNGLKMLYLQAEASWQIWLNNIR